jgi:hypothetical protein
VSLHKTRIMYIERKEESLSGPARIGRVTFSKSGRSVSYRGRTFLKSKRGYKWNHIDMETSAHYWISGPRKDGQDRLYPQRHQPVEIDDDVRVEYWTKIRGMPSHSHRSSC